MKKLLLKLLLLLTILLTTTYAQEKPQAVIIFDASGSMWGQIDGKAKITIAKDALNSVVKKWNPEVELGLTAYGHRKKGDCNDIETLVPVGAIDKDKIISLVKKIQPKGKTPIARSLKKVAEELKFTEEKATIILISDGKESCDANPCDVAKELEKKGIDFVTHVIGFNVDKKTDKQLECIADATGGEYFSAKNATALNDAMKKIVKKVEKVEPTPTPTPTPKPTPKKLKNSLEVTASEKEGGKWIKASYDIYKQNDEGKEGKRMTNTSFTSKKEAVNNKLPVGKYIIEADYNAFNKKIPFEIKADEVTKLHIVFGQTSKVEVRASETKGGKWIKASYNIYMQNDEGKEGKRMTNTTSTSTKKDAISHKLPVGKYIIEADYNAFNKKMPFEVKADEVTKLHIIFAQTGKVFVSASETEGGKRLTATCRIYNEDKSNDWNIYPRKKEDSMSYKQLPVGKYFLNCEYKAFKKKDIPIEIKAGEMTKVHVNFTPFHVTIKGINQCSIVNHEVISPKGRFVTESKAPANKGTDFVLPDGTYYIESTANGVTKKNKITIGGADATKGLTVDFGGEDTKGSVEGEWKENSGIVTKIRLNGIKVQGSYSKDNGEIVGEMTYPQKFEGFWIEDDSDVKCSTAKNGRYHWGRLVWEFEDDMCSLKAKWSYCDKKPNRSGPNSIFIKFLPKEPTKEELIKADSETSTTKIK